MGYVHVSEVLMITNYERTIGYANMCSSVQYRRIKY